jgi:uncharacterized protein with HEPN domain
MSRDPAFLMDEVMGEAAKRLSAEFCAAHPEVEWSEVAKTRDFLIHHYGRVDLGQVWTIASEDLATLIPKLERIAPREEDD